MHSHKTAVARIATASRLFSSSSSKSQERWARRCRLLDASRGALNDGARDHNNSRISSSTKKRPLPVFPLEARHFGGYDKLGSDEKSLPPNSPKEFHQSLCEMIRNAKDRVRIASLYVGPATSNREDCTEAEFLEALSELVERNHSNTDEKSVSVKIILDENRALRPVPSISTPTKGSEDISNMTTSSAEAVACALRNGIPSDGDSSSSLHLFRVLPPTTIGTKKWLPNPLDEIAGVFHIKIYIVDDQLLLSGANLSREYFTDRMDRYLHLVDGANGLVDFYADLVDILCRHSSEYHSTAIRSENGAANKDQMREQQTKRADFLREITEHFQDPNGTTSSSTPAEDIFAQGDTNDDNTNGENKIVAVGVPTFQAPVGYFRHKDVVDVTPTPLTIASDVVTALATFSSLFWINRQPADKVDFVTDVDATLDMLREAGKTNYSSATGKSDLQYSAQLSSAYLNPTTTLLSALQDAFQKIELLSAGKVSHGFKPKEKECKEGSQGKDWTIPSIFDKLVDECMSSLRSKNGMDARLFLWERPNWTFHGKGIWLTEEAIAPKGNVGSENREVAAVVVGSSNFGYRSFYRDMESNLLLVFPPGFSNSIQDDMANSDIASSFGEEWKNLIASSKREVLENDSDGMKENGGKVDAPEKAPPLPLPILKSIPYIKTFF